MRPYIAQLNLDVKAGFNPAADPKRNDASVLPVSAQGAQAINLSNVDRIDGSLYFEGGQTYLAIKRQGRFNEIWRAAAPGGNGWTLVNNNLAVGSEAPSIAKLNGVYYLYTDDISTDQSHNGANGTRFSSSTNLYSAFTARQVINAVRPNGSSLTVLNHGANAWKQNGPRHGTVITLTDPAAKKIVWDLYKSQFKTDKTSSFTDVAWNHWAVNQGWLEYAVKNNLMTGYKTNGKLNGAFGPEDTLTRGQVATVLYRIATGKDSGDGSTGFKDAGAFPYYRTAIKWLKDNGISTGDKDPKTQKPLNTFRPDAPITRQELATLVYRFAKQQGVKTGTVSTGSLNKFKDGGAVLPYAREAMAWANGAGVITGGQGADAGKVMPGNNATRAQAAKIFSVTHRDVLKK